MDKRRYPTVVAFGPTDHGNMAEAIQVFVDQMGWRKMAAIRDKLVKLSGLNTMFLVHFTNLQKKFEGKNTAGKYDLSTFEFDSTKSDSMPVKYALYKELLLKAANATRGGKSI